MSTHGRHSRKNKTQTSHSICMWAAHADCQRWISSVHRSMYSVLIVKGEPCEKVERGSSHCERSADGSYSHSFVKWNEKSFNKFATVCLAIVFIAFGCCVGSRHTSTRAIQCVHYAVVTMRTDVQANTCSNELMSHESAMMQIIRDTFICSRLFQLPNSRR